MAKRQRLTNNTDETEIAQLFSGDNFFSIPYFQRPYRWKPDRLRQLCRDLLVLVDEGEFHFLGAIIIHGRRSNPSEPDVYEVIDGQQRLTTLFLLLCATIRVLCEAKQYQEAKGLFLKYLVLGRDTQLISNIKLHSSKDDRAQLNSVFTELMGDKGFQAELGSFKLKLLPATGQPKGTLRNNYLAAYRFLREQFKLNGLERIIAIYTALLERVSIVQIDVWDPTNGPKIFDSLNSRQEPMTIGDLVRNEIFSKVADEHPDVIEGLDQTAWQPFYKKFQQGEKNFFDAFFFPFGLTQNPNLKKSEVYHALRKDWESIDDAEQIIARLSTFQDAFLDVVCGTRFQPHEKAVSDAFHRLYKLEVPSSTYPFLMLLSNAARDGSVGPKETMETIEVIESFLVRRAISGYEPTGLHAVFKRLWQDCGGAPTREKVEKEIRKHKTVSWPSDEEVMRAVRERPMYGSSVDAYFIGQHNESLGGDVPQTFAWMEHVLPENPVAEWFDAGHFTKQQHAEMKDLAANLIPLSKEMNQGLSNSSYEKKRPVYAGDSMFKSAREFANSYSKWSATDLIARSDHLAQWAIQRWRF